MRAEYGSGSDGWVDNAPLREAVKARLDKGELSLNGICIRLGWRKGGVAQPQKGDTTRLRRRLGMSPPTSGRKRLSRRLRYDLAVQICEAADLNFLDMGL